MSTGSHMRSIAWWHFQWPWWTSNPVFQVTVFLKSNLKYCAFYGQSFYTTLSSQPHPIYRMVPLSMTLSDLWPGFQDHDIFWSRISEKRRVLKQSNYCTRVKIPNIWNGTMFGDLDWPLNASREFVSISWSSCWNMKISVCPVGCLFSFS